MVDPKRTLNCRGRLLSLERPVVMGILNVTPDSFYDGGRYRTAEQALDQAGRMLTEGACIIDIGGMSTRPGADLLSPEEEKRRVLPAIEQVLKAYPEALLSIDTIHAGVARAAVDAGACIVNDISAGRLDPAMYETVAELGVPYILMHMQGDPQTMHLHPAYEDVVGEVLDFFIRQLARLRSLGIKDIVLDPGFGFGKTLRHNYQLLKHLHVFQVLDLPVLAGISRKSMVYRPLGTTPEQALNGTTALHMVALQQGARILRVHDVREAREVITCWEQLEHTSV